MDGPTVIASFEPVHRPALDIPPLSDAVCRIWEGNGERKQEKLVAETVAGEQDFYSASTQWPGFNSSGFQMN